MASQRDQQDSADLERVNAELTASLERCRELLAECQSKLAANSNEPAAPLGREAESGTE